MTPQEQDLINGLVDRVQKTQLPEKDADAERLLQQSLGRNPDSLYILAQTVLVQQYALDQAQKQLSELRAQVEQLRQQPPKSSTSFLGGLFGQHDTPPPPPQQSFPAGQPQGGQYAPVPNYGGQPGYAAPQYGSPQYAAPAQGGEFLRGAMQTAAGVAAGALAFQGVESLLHGFGGEGGGRGFEGGGRPEEIVNNNYYGDDARGGDRESGRDFAGSGDGRDDAGGVGDNIFTDGNDRDANGGGGDSLTDSSDDDGDSSFDDDNNSDDGGGFDDGGSSDDSSF